MQFINRICVFCGSDLGENLEYVKATKKLACSLINRNIELVFGGGNTGLMRILADSFYEKGKSPIGILPQEYSHKQLLNPNSVTIFSRSRHERLETMMQMSDGFITLPGSYGTIKELMTILEDITLGKINKPCAILNTASFFDNLIRFFDQCLNDKFLNQAQKDVLIVSNDPDIILDAFENYTYEIPLKEWR